MASKSGFQCDPEMSLAGARLLARRCPACRRRESDLGFCMEREKARADTGSVSGSSGGRPERECVEQQKL